MKKGILILACAMAIPNGWVLADEPQDVGTLTGNIEITRGAIQQLENELAKNMAQTNFDASDYKEWNVKFRAALNQEMLKYEARIEKDIFPTLKPLANQYQEILQNKTLRDDQLQLLKQSQLQRLQMAADSLAPKYAEIYLDVYRDLMGWLPVIKISNYSDANAVHRHIFNKAFSTIFFLTGVGAVVEIANGGDGYFERTNTNGRVRFNYEISSLDGKSHVINGYYNQEKVTYNVQTCDINSSLLGCLDEFISQSSKRKSVIMDTYFKPGFEQDCHSQVCLALKEADLGLAISALSQQMDRPFTMQFPDNQKIEIKAPGFDVSGYSGYLKTTITDPKLPFDTTKTP